MNSTKIKTMSKKINDLNNKTILVTGGTGSFGQRFISKILSSSSPKKIIVFHVNHDISFYRFCQNDLIQQYYISHFMHTVPVAYMQVHSTYVLNLLTCENPSAT